MEEPQRIGLSKEANSYLDEMLDAINSEVDSSNEKLIKFDLYRLAVAIGVKKNKRPPAIKDNTESSFRVGELDPDRALYIAVEAADLHEQEEPIYRIVERLAEQGIRDFYKAYRDNMGRIPWNKILV